MDKKISFIILSNSGSTIKQVAIPVVWIVALACVSIIGLLFLGITLNDYRVISNSLDGNRLMAQTIEEQSEELGQQRMQIQAFAHEINALKDHLLKLDKFEEKIRVIANLDPRKGDDSLFGVGGAAPSDLDPQLELTERHVGLVREIHQNVEELDKAAQYKESSFGTLIEKLEGQRNLLAATPAVRPASGWVTSRFGERTSPFTGRSEFHKGLDIANRPGTPIQAPADGVVSFAGKNGSMGTVLVIDHGHGMVTRYGHLATAIKKPGQKVKRGETIAQMGSSGRSTGPHVHYEVHINGVPVNPTHYIMN